jgi:exopolyphosphatase/guanosine-5'-triphosphate,3'-diphosphate pyrophosphatase
MSSRRCAFLDIGTNTILCLIAECDESGQFRVLDDLAEITRLGKGVDQTRLISQSGEERSAAVLGSYLDRCARLGVEEITAVGTSALRDASNSGEVLARWQRQLGLQVRVISGEEEAACSFVAAREGLALAGQELLVIDIGGGSTEFIRGNAAGISEAVSVDVGSVRLTERFVHSDPVIPEEFRSMTEEIERAVAPVVSRWLRDMPALTLVGIAATFTTLVAVQKGLAQYAHAAVHGSRIADNEVRRQIELYRAMSNARRQALPGLHPQRADVILAGALLVERIMTLFDARHVIVSDQGVRYGLLHRRFSAASSNQLRTRQL